MPILNSTTDFYHRQEGFWFGMSLALIGMGLYWFSPITLLPLLLITVGLSVACFEVYSMHRTGDNLSADTLAAVCQRVAKVCLISLGYFNFYAFLLLSVSPLAPVLLVPTLLGVGFSLLLGLVSQVLGPRLPTEHLLIRVNPHFGNALSESPRPNDLEVQPFVQSSNEEDLPLSTEETNSL